MAPPITDKSICRACRLREPEVSIVRVKGLPQGECKQCKRLRQLRHRMHVNFHLGFYRAIPDLVAANAKTLSTLHNGAYPLTKNTDRAQIGYIIVQTGSIYVRVYNDSDLFKYDLWGIASYLGNLNACIGSASALDRPTIDASAFVGLDPIDVQERLIWYDRALNAKAARMLSDGIRQAKAANMALARQALSVHKTPTK